MCSTFSIAAKPCIRERSGKLVCQKYYSKIASTRAEVGIAPKQSSPRVFPELSKQGIPLTHLHIPEIVKRQSPIHNPVMREDVCRKPHFHPGFLDEAYERCRKICAEYAKTFYLGTALFIYKYNSMPT